MEKTQRVIRFFVILTILGMGGVILQAAEEILAPDDVETPPEDAKITESGLASKVLVEGTGTERPHAMSTVTVHYTGWTTDGKMFDSSVVRGSTATFSLSRVIEGWIEGLQLMVIGEKRRFWIPAELAYGERDDETGETDDETYRVGGMLVFDVELVDFQ